MTSIGKFEVEVKVNLDKFEEALKEALEDSIEILILKEDTSNDEKQVNIMNEYNSKNEDAARLSNALGVTLKEITDAINIIKSNKAYPEPSAEFKRKYTCGRDGYPCIKCKGKETCSMRVNNFPEEEKSEEVIEEKAYPKSTEELPVDPFDDESEYIEEIIEYQFMSTIAPFVKFVKVEEYDVDEIDG